MLGAGGGGRGGGSAVLGWIKPKKDASERRRKTHQASGLKRGKEWSGVGGGSGWRGRGWYVCTVCGGHHGMLGVVAKQRLSTPPHTHTSV